MSKSSLVFRLDPHTSARLLEAEKVLLPKLLELTGTSERLRSSVIRIALLKGIQQIEREDQQLDIESDPALSARIDRIVQHMSPRIKCLIGRLPSRNEIILSLIDRGASDIEREYSLKDAGNILVDE